MWATHNPSIIAESFTVTYYNVSIELFAFEGSSGRKKGREGGRKEGRKEMKEARKERKEARKEGRKDRRVFDSS